jgi:type IV secretion system protein VirB10
VPESIRNPEPPPAVSARTGSEAPKEDPSRDAERERRVTEARQLVDRARASGLHFDVQARTGGVGESGASAAGAALPFAAPRRSGGEVSPLASREEARERDEDGQADPNLQARKNAFLEGKRSKEVLSTSVEAPRSPFEVKAGSVIPAVLLTAINSDLPGPVIGQVRENVYDTVTGNHLLIPQGAKLLATYDSMVAWGQERVLVCWNRLLFPDGRSIALECMPAADLQGAAGLTDEVDEHWWRILKGVGAASLLAATAQGVAGNVQGFNAPVPQLWARGAAQEVNSAGQQLLRRNIQIQPTITVRPGFSVNVLVTRDMILPPPRERLGLFAPGMRGNP